MRPATRPDFLCHYYEAATGPFLNLSDLASDKAERVLNTIRARGETFASKRSADYLQIRGELEVRVRKLFILKGGKPRRKRPHYMILGSCPWVREWYQDGRELVIALAIFRPEIVSFTYGDTFPAMRYQDGRPYRGQVYTLQELAGIVRLYGLPQTWNHDGRHGPDRYIEAQVWDDEPIRQFLPGGGPTDGK